MRKFIGPTLLVVVTLVACVPPGQMAGEKTGSIGKPSNGRLVDGVQLAACPEIHVIEPDNAWGTVELVHLLETVSFEMRLAYPDTAPLVVGHLSKRRGGPLSPHRSHQSGRDVDVAIYDKGNTFHRHFRDMGGGKMDAEKTWYFIETLMRLGKIQYIFMDYALQKQMVEAIRVAVPEQEIERVFQYPHGRGARRGIVRHTSGHRNHLHIRIHCPIDDAYCIN